MAADTSKNPVIDSLAKKTGVAPAEVRKVLQELGFDRFYAAAVKAKGSAPSLDQAKLMFRLSRNSVIC